MKAQVVVLNEAGEAAWTKVLLDKGTVPVEVLAPPPKKHRAGSSFDEVRARLAHKWEDVGGVEMVRLLDLFQAISPLMTAKSPGQKLKTYGAHLGMRKGVDFVQKTVGARGRGSPPYWVTLAAAKAVYAYEVHGRECAAP